MREERKVKDTNGFKVCVRSDDPRQEPVRQVYLLAPFPTRY